MNQGQKSVKSKAEFMSSWGISPELAEFVNAFVKTPEKFLPMAIEKRREIENQMDAILSSIEL